MKNVVFLMTHTGSDWPNLTEFLNSHENIQCYRTGHSYWHPDDLSHLTNQSHKKNNAASVWVDVIFENKDFACEALCKSCGFIYWAKPFEDTVWGDDERYYRHRLFGLRSYYQRTPKAVWNPELKSDLFLSSVFGRE